jgi:hypothetical protein
VDAYLKKCDGDVLLSQAIRIAQETHGLCQGVSLYGVKSENMEEFAIQQTAGVFLLADDKHCVAIDAYSRQVVEPGLSTVGSLTAETLLDSVEGGRKMYKIRPDM